MAESGEESFEVIGELEVGVAVGGLRVEGDVLVLQAGLTTGMSPWPLPRY